MSRCWWTLWLALMAALAVEIWRNPDTGSWTITASTPAGIACMVASGEAFDDRDDPVPVIGEDG